MMRTWTKVLCLITLHQLRSNLKTRLQKLRQKDFLMKEIQFLMNRLLYPLQRKMIFSMMNLKKESLKSKDQAVRLQWWLIWCDRHLRRKLKTNETSVILPMKNQVKSLKKSQEKLNHQNQSLLLNKLQTQWNRKAYLMMKKNQISALILKRLKNLK